MRSGWRLAWVLSLFWSTCRIRNDMDSMPMTPYVNSRSTLYWWKAKIEPLRCTLAAHWSQRLVSSFSVSIDQIIILANQKICALTSLESIRHLWS